MLVEKACPRCEGLATVYVLYQDWGYSGIGLHGVFSSVEEAKKAAADYCAVSRPRGGALEWLDPPTQHVAFGRQATETDTDWCVDQFTLDVDRGPFP